MTKDNPYQIGASTDKPSNSQSSFFKPNKNSNPKQFNNQNSDKPNYQKNKPINKKFNSQKRPFNKNNQRQSNNRNNQRSFNNRDRKPFNRDEKKSFNRNDRKPFNRNDRQPFQRKDRKPFDKSQRRPFNRNQRKPYDRNDRKPFDRNDRKPFDRNDRKPYRSQKFSGEKSDQQTQNKNIKHEEKQFKQIKQNVDQNNINSNEKKVEEKGQKAKVQKIKHNRVIIRNLVFDINVNHLKKLLSPFGEILDVHIPQNPDGKGSRGFAFIEFKNRNNALKAIKQLNGTQFKGRTIVLDESVSKQKFIQSKVNEEEDVNDQKKIEEQGSNKVKLEENKKQKLEMESQNNQEQQNDEQQKDQNQQDDDEEEDQEQMKNQEVKKEGSKRQKTESQILQDISSQVFIRNLPITVDEKTLHSFFRKYGKLKFAKIVMNKQTGLSKGSAFLKFEDPLKAKELVQYSRSYEMNLLGKNPNFKVNAGINLQLEGTILKLFPVESRQNISQKLKVRDQKDAKREEMRKQQEKKKKPIKKVKNLQKLVEYDPNDKRNLKLALLGINKVTQQMREKDQERFRNHEKQKIEKLKNPNNSVSDTRIVLKYLNKDITEQDIRNLCLEYLEQTNHKANDLTYCKLMLESLETKKSAGFAFVQFKTHQIALAFLQWIAIEPTKLMRDPFICQFAIQDSRKLQKLQNRNNTTKTTSNKPQGNKNKSMNKNKSISKNKGKKTKK